MKILLINHYAGSERYGMEFRPFYFSREWVRAGHEVRIVAASFSHLRKKQPEINSSLSKEKIDGIEYFWLKTPKYFGNSIGRILNILTFLYRLFFFSKKIIKDFPADIVVASSTYPLDVFCARRLAKLSGGKMVFEVHDLWPLTPMELGGYSKWNPLIMGLQFAEDFAYKKSHRVISLLPGAEKYMKSRGLAEKKFVYIPNGIEITDNNRTEELSEDIVSAIDLARGRNHFLIGYAGTLSLSNKLEILLTSAKGFVGKDKSFFILGKGPEEEKLKKICQSEGLDNVTFLPAIEKTQVGAFLAKMDCLYLGFAKSPLYRFGVSPNKLMDYMLSAKPIVCGIEASNRPVDEAGCGYTIAAEDPEAVVEAIDKIARLSAEERAAMGLRGLEYVRKCHDYKVLSEKFIEGISD